MLTKYILTIGETEYPIPDECLKNWDEISFSLKRTDYSGVMRSFSTEFIFVGEIYDLLFAEYLDKGFLASASVAVYTITNRHEWELQYSAALDFSTIEIEAGSLSINAMDNALASLLKSKKSQKYEYLMSSFSTTQVNVNRMELVSYASYSFPKKTNRAGFVTALLNENGSQIISKEYIEPCSEIWDYGGSDNRFFANVNKSDNDLRLVVRLTGTVRCYLCATKKGGVYGGDVPIAYLKVKTYLPGEGEGSEDRVTRSSTLTCDDLLHQVIHGNPTNMLINDTLGNVASSKNALIEMALAKFGQDGTISSDYNGIFGIVMGDGGTSDTGQQAYWLNNIVYEYQDGSWNDKGVPKDYYQDRNISDGIGGYNGKDTVPLPAGNNGAYICLEISESSLYMSDASMTINWGDPVRATLLCNCITPLQLITKIVHSITGEETAVSIAADDAGLIAKTYLLPGEELRKISDAKVYSTFGNFADWMEAVFGYTYRVVGDELQFVHRSEVFVSEVAKTIESYRDVKLSIVDDLIYTTVEAGYAKKEYGEIDGRLEKNFTNYYSTGYSLTDKKLTLQSKYRADSYGIEFTARKSESESKTTDDKSDEDVFFIHIYENAETGVNTYQPNNNNAYNPSVCVANNKAFIAVFGNGKAVTLTMTSSDGDNELDPVTIAAGTALFTAAEIEFTTEDMELPEDLNALVQLDHNGHRYTGYIKEAEARYGRENGVEYTLIVKEITAL